MQAFFFGQTYDGMDNISEKREVRKSLEKLEAG